MNKKQLDPTSSPWAPFGVQLRRSREGQGLTQAQLARKVKYDPSYVSFVELAQRPPSEKFAAKADEVLETGGTLSLMYWQHRHTALVPGFPEYANYESRAAEIRLFEIDVVPGLLQTVEYATALEAGHVRQGSATRGQAEERVNFLTTRQQCLERTSPPLVHAVLDESCIRRPIGGRDVMIAQLLHLEAMAQRPDIAIQVAPFSLGENRPFMRMVFLLTMPDRRVLGYSENEQRGFLDREAEAVLPLVKSYDRLQIEAMNQADSMAMIRSVRRDFEWTSI
ncbi:helix-turn-helix transcriptional regulator [Streptomyces sp. CB01881]|uniref:helix-turn-helix domain-containing protein n=1 Tax=Streptomyces sp. CB01881 TaxID=2078691 RepID=UPI001F11F316|nr:helix-turn-helix transcriptional regulator [Streptomyces sp. CB01881]